MSSSMILRASRNSASFGRLLSHHNVKLCQCQQYSAYTRPEEEVDSVVKTSAAKSHYSYPNIRRNMREKYQLDHHTIKHETLPSISNEMQNEHDTNAAERRKKLREKYQLDQCVNEADDVYFVQSVISQPRWSAEQEAVNSSDNDTRLASTKLESKYKSLLRSNEKVDRLYNVAYGTVRFDADNISELDNEETGSRLAKKSGFVDLEYFPPRDEVNTQNVSEPITTSGLPELVDTQHTHSDSTTQHAFPYVSEKLRTIETEMKNIAVEETPKKRSDRPTQDMNTEVMLSDTPDEIDHMHTDQSHTQSTRDTSVVDNCNDTLTQTAHNHSKPDTSYEQFYYFIDDEELPPKNHRDEDQVRSVTDDRSKMVKSVSKAGKTKSVKQDIVSDDQSDDLYHEDSYLADEKTPEVRKDVQSENKSYDRSAASNVNKIPKHESKHRKLQQDTPQSTKVEKEINVEKNSEDFLVDGKGRRHVSTVNFNNPETAYDVVRKIRRGKHGKQVDGAEDKVNTTLPQHAKWEGLVDTKGFRKLKGQVMDISNMAEYEVVSMLNNSILHVDEHIVAIDKPYGLPSHGGPGVHHSVGALLPGLAKMMNVEKLYLVHRLDKETTGAMVLARTEDMYRKLLAMFKKRQVMKKYWVITKDVPTQPEGIIDIPLKEIKVEGKYRMTCTLAGKRQLFGRRGGAHDIIEAVTKYRVLDANGKAALIECEPSTGVKHQIRCHMAIGLNTPVLGDHKYSHNDRLAPQKLHNDMLQKLGIRQPTVRYLPMHLHAHQIVLPQLYDNRNIFIRCRLPAFFAQNMKWLRLKAPTYDLEAMKMHEK